MRLSRGRPAATARLGPPVASVVVPAILLVPDRWRRLAFPGLDRIVPGGHETPLERRAGRKGLVPCATGPTVAKNLTSLCVAHHLRCVHAGYLRVTGLAPGRLHWTFRRGGGPLLGQGSGPVTDSAVRPVVMPAVAAAFAAAPDLAAA